MIKETICYVAGKSGGHIIPALTLIQQVKQKNNHTRILFFSTNAVLDQSLLANTKDIDTWVALALGNIPRKQWWRLPLFIGQCLRSFLHSLYLLLIKRPSKIVSMGGYISLPVCCAGWLLRIPIEVYELNAVPGTAVQVLQYIASSLFICFDQAQKSLRKKSIKIAYPVRFTQTHYQLNGANKERKVMLILGGSQGSHFINESIKKVVVGLQKDFLHIIHQTGNNDIASMHLFYEQQGISAQVFAFSENLADYYVQADLIISRAGAGSLFEIAFFNKKAIVIPLEVATTHHQVDNAVAIAQEYPHLFSVILQKDINADGATELSNLVITILKQVIKDDSCLY